MQSINSFTKYNKFLIVPRQENDLDCLAASFALASSLKSMQKDVTVFLDSHIYTEKIKNKLPTKGVNIIDGNDMKSIVVTLDNLNAKIKDIRWREGKGKIDIIIGTDDSSTETVISEDIRVKMKRFEYDVTFVVGLHDLTELGSLYTQHRDLFAVEKTVLISKEGSNGLFKYQRYPVFTPTISQSMYHFIKEKDLHFNEHISTLLLTGLYWGTRSFSQEVSKSTFTVAAQLAEKGARIVSASNRASNTLTYPETKYYSFVFANARQAEPGIFYSIIDGDILTLKLIDNLLLNNTVPISTINGCYFAFVIIKTDKGNRVFLKSNTNKISTLPIIKQHKGRGNKAAGTFIVSTPEKELVRALVDYAKSEKEKPSLENKKESENERNVAQTEENKAQVQENTLNMPQRDDSPAQLPAASIVGNSKSEDPLAPATILPEPLHFEKADKAINSPLPEAGTLDSPIM